MRRIEWLMIGAGLGLAACGCTRKEPPPAGIADCRHVIVISLDTLRADHLGCYGSSTVKTPALDALAAESVRYEHAMTTAPVTLAAHTSLMTGTYPHTHGVPGNGFRVHADNMMLAEIYRDAGYATAGFIGATPLSKAFGFGQGFVRFDEEFGKRAQSAAAGESRRRAESVTDAVIAYVAEAVPQHLFLFVHYFDAHAPYDPPPAYKAMYPGAPKRVPRTIDETAGTAILRHQSAALGRNVPMNVNSMPEFTRQVLLAGAGEPLEGDEAIHALYCGEISYLDYHVGRLIDGLRKTGVLDDALLVVVADHGDTFWEHFDFFNHGLAVYDTAARVPLLVRYPHARNAGKVVSTPVSLVDIVPSLLRCTGLRAPADVEGRVIFAPDGPVELAAAPVFCEAAKPPGSVVKGPWPNAGKAHGVRLEQWKFISTPYLGVEELYDVIADPGEKVNLLVRDAEKHRSDADRLRAVLAAWDNRADPLPVVDAAKDDPENLRRLRGLGYVGDESP